MRGEAEETDIRRRFERISTMGKCITAWERSMQAEILLPVNEDHNSHERITRMAIGDSRIMTMSIHLQEFDEIN